MFKPFMLKPSEIIKIRAREIEAENKRRDVYRRKI